MTAAYMTRCVYLTFYGERRGAAAHHEPHESPITITAPLVILAFLACTAGLLNAPKLDLFSKWIANDVVLTAGVPTHEFLLSAAALSVAIGLAGIGFAFWYWFREGLPFLRDLSTRSAPAGTAKRLLLNKYYLDDLYEGVIIKGIREPIANGAYWINQNVIDGVVNAVGLGARQLADFTYNVIDQRGIDGAVNGAGLATESAGSGLRHMQTGRVQQYAAVLFGAAGLAALALVLFS